MSKKPSLMEGGSGFVGGQIFVSCVSKHLQ